MSAVLELFFFFCIWPESGSRRVLLTLSTHSPSEGEEQRVGPALMGNTGILHSVAIYSTRRVRWQTALFGLSARVPAIDSA